MLQTSLPNGLKVDPSCYRALRWRMDFDLEAEGMLTLGSALKKKGFKSITDVLFPALISLESAAGHQIVLVTKTGRIQIRIHYETEENMRLAEAQQIANIVTETASSCRLLPEQSA